MLPSLRTTGFQRTLSSLLLAFVLLVSNGHLLRSLLAPSGCATGCCRTRASCCCRKRAPLGKVSAKVAAPTCPPGCAQTALPIAFPDGVAENAPSAFASLQAILNLVAVALTLIRATLCFALSQRPPPFPLLRTANQF